ncbi:hypothetical protein ACH4TU_19080 [Streptomyces physcomitrii]
MDSPEDLLALDQDNARSRVAEPAVYGGSAPGNLHEGDVVAEVGDQL